MSDLIVAPPVAIPAMSEAAIENVRRLENHWLQKPQVAIDTEHVIHARVYLRTICVPAGKGITGALIKIATTLIISGDATVYLDDSEIRLTGYAVLPASAGRKQAFVAHADTFLTMLFATDARTVEDAELQFTDEADRLWSRHGVNHTLITGE